MSVPKICKYCKYWDFEAKFKYGMGGSGCLHCKYSGDRRPEESCSRWEFASDRTEEDFKDLKKYYDIG